MYFCIQFRIENNLSDTVNETLLLLNEGNDIDAIASQRDINVSTVYTHIADAIEAGLLDAKEVLQLNDSEYDEIIAALEMSDDEAGRLKPVFDAFDGNYDYGILKCVQASF